MARPEDDEAAALDHATQGRMGGDPATGKVYDVGGYWRPGTGYAGDVPNNIVPQKAVVNTDPRWQAGNPYVPGWKAQ